MTAGTPRGKTTGRILGIALLVVGIIGVVLSIVGMIAGIQIVNGVGATAQSVLAITTDGLTTAKGTLEQVKTGIAQVQTGLVSAETIIIETGDTISQSDESLKGILTTVSQDVPDTIDSVQAAVPPAAEAAKSFLVEVEGAMVGASALVEQNGPVVNGVFKTVSQDVPNSLDYWSAAIPPNVEATHNFLGNLETTMASSGETLRQVDAAWQQGVRFASKDVPDTIDYWSAAIPPNVALWKAYLASAQAALDNASAMVRQTDATLDQAVRMTSHDAPAVIDYWRSAIPPNVALWKAYLANAQAVLDNTSAMVSQTDAQLDQAVKVASHDVPDAIDAWNSVIPANAEMARAYLSNAEAALENASAVAGQADATIDQVLKVASHDVPDTIDYWNAAIPPSAQLWKAYVNAAEEAMVNASDVAREADTALDQVFKVASQDVPNTIDYWNAAVPPTAQLWKAYVDATEAAMVNASAVAREADAALEQAVRVTSQDVPNAIDAWGPAIPANAELAKAYLTNAEVALENASAMVEQANATLDQAVKVASQDVPNTLDAVQGSVPVTADAARAVLQNLDNSMDWAGLGVDQTRAALDLTNDAVQASLEQLSAGVPSTVEATEAQVNYVLALLTQLQYLDATYRVQMDDSAGQLAANLEYLAALLQATDSTVNANLDAVDQGLATLSYNTDLLNQQIDQYVAMSSQLQLLSQQLRGLEPAYNSSLDLESVVQYFDSMAQNVAAMKAQIDQLVALSSQLELLSQQLRAVGPAYESSGVDLGAISQYISAMTVNADAINAQIDQGVALSGQLDLVSQQLRVLEPAYNSSLDLGALSLYLDYLAQNAAPLNAQVDQLATLSSQQLDLTSQQMRSLEPLYESNVDIEALSLYLDYLAQNAGALNAQVDQLATLSSQQLDLTSQQMRSLEPLYESNVDIEALNLYLDYLSQNAAALSPWIDVLAGLSDQQMELVSQQLQAVEPIYNSNVDLGAASQSLDALSLYVASVSAQLDQVAAVSDQMDQVSQQLRQLEVYSGVSLGLGQAGEDVALMSQYVAIADQQVDQLAAASGILDQWSGALRTLEPYANIDYGAISQQILDLSGNLPAVRDQIDQLVVMSGQLEQLSGALRSLEPIAETDFNEIGRTVSNLSTNVSAVNTQLDQFAGMTDQFVVTVDNTNASISQIQATLDSRLNLVKLVIVIFMLWMLLGQLVPLYLGWVLLSGRLHYVAAES